MSEKTKIIQLMYIDLIHWNRSLYHLFTVIDPWSLSRTMQIIIRDDTYRDVIKWCSLPKSFLSKFRPRDNIDGTSNRDLESKTFVIMVEPNIQ